MICDGATLLKVLAMLDSVPAKKGSASDYFRLVCGRGVLRISLSSSIIGQGELTGTTEESPWEGFVLRTALKAFAGKGLSGPVTITQTEKGIQFKVAKRRGSFAAPVEYPKGHQKLPEDLREEHLILEDLEEIKVAASYCSQDAATPELQSVYLSGDGYIFSTNRLQAFRAGTQSTSQGYIPAVFASLLDEAEVFVSKHGVRLVYGFGWLLYLANARASEFPMGKLASMFEAGDAYKQRLKLDRESLLEAIEAVARLHSEQKTFVMSKSVDSEQLTISSSSTSADLETEIDYEGSEEEAFKEEILIASVLPFLKNSRSRNIFFHWEQGSNYVLRASKSTRRLFTSRRAS